MAWDMGSQADGSDSCARVVAERGHWPEMRALVLVVDAEKKEVSSTAGMQETVRTSELFKERVRIVPGRMKAMERAIRERDFEGFARGTMAESNGFHATCLDTQPPIRYLNDVSWAAMQAVSLVNKAAGRVLAAYTFDAGPNAVIYYLEKDWGMVAASLAQILREKEGWVERGSTGEGADLSSVRDVLEKGVSRVIITSVGEGPISVQDHLIDENGDAVIA